MTRTRNGVFILLTHCRNEKNRFIPIESRWHKTVIGEGGILFFMTYPEE